MDGESELILRAQQGDDEAYSLLCEPCLPRLRRLAAAFLKNHDDAEDAVQETLFKAWRNLGGFLSLSSFSGWLRSILVRECFMVLRRRRRFAQGLTETEAAEKMEKSVPQYRGLKNRAIGRVRELVGFFSEPKKGKST
jgi:DNA-directed RNA polymerase specialized sigma24 family protein